MQKWYQKLMVRHRCMRDVMKHEASFIESGDGLSSVSRTVVQTSSI